MTRKRAELLSDLNVQAQRQLLRHNTVLAMGCTTCTTASWSIEKCEQKMNEQCDSCGRRKGTIQNYFANKKNIIKSLSKSLTNLKNYYTS